MQRISRSKGVDGGDEVFTVARESAIGGFEPATGEFAEPGPPVECVLWYGGEREIAATLPAAWVEAAEDDDEEDSANVFQVAVSFPRATLAPLPCAEYVGRIQLTDLSGHLKEFTFVLLPGPASTPIARRAYHTIEQLKNANPWIERFADELNDESGFAELAEEAADWADLMILDEVRRTCGGGFGAGYAWGGHGTYLGYGHASLVDRYTAAMAAGRVKLDTPGGRALSRACRDMTLALVLDRVYMMSNDRAQVEGFDARAEALKAQAAAAFSSSMVVEFADVEGDPTASLAPVRFGRLMVGRLVRG